MIVSVLSVLAVIAVLAVVKLGFAGGGTATENGTGAPATAAAGRDPDTAAVGNCVRGGSADDLAVVGCTDPAATYRVVAKVDGTRAAFDADDDLTFCKSAPEADSAFFDGPATGKGYILCLAPVELKPS